MNAFDSQLNTTLECGIYVSAVEAPSTGMCRLAHKASSVVQRRSNAENL